jgi:hypothetical protein
MGDGQNELHTTSVVGHSLPRGSTPTSRQVRKGLKADATAKNETAKRSRALAGPPGDTVEIFKEQHFASALCRSGVFQNHLATMSAPQCAGGADGGTYPSGCPILALACAQSMKASRLSVSFVVTGDCSPASVGACAPTGICSTVAFWPGHNDVSSTICPFANSKAS